MTINNRCKHKSRVFYLNFEIMQKEYTILLSLNNYPKNVHFHSSTNALYLCVVILSVCIDLFSSTSVCKIFRTVSFSLVSHRTVFTALSNCQSYVISGFDNFILLQWKTFLLIIFAFVQFLTIFLFKSLKSSS